MWAADWKDTSYWLDDMPQVSGVSSDLKRKVDAVSYTHLTPPTKA